ncbi:hypothetical protein [Tsukamurella tyrosinosolvens]|uniref:hypothetical protein n=1 Tax=Tsukamurella tyrosinosolvens TaxID=57704 RepID=UPI002DD435C8|nr:hypothetical protein [Tsukamurella tyrosinosolvens]MEC4616308.1 hypothetical protein [Tsukamurella tyrosinosolvens]
MLNPELKAALDLYVEALEADDGMSYTCGAIISKAWQRCVALGATRQDQVDAFDRVGR